MVALTGKFCIGWWWSSSSASTMSTAACSPADGVRSRMDLTEEGCRRQIEARVRRVGALGGYGQGLGGGGPLTGENRAGARSGSGRPESGKKASSRSS